jgi:hypothetical protein
MRIVPIESVPMEERAHVREGVFRSRRLLNGTPGTPGNFALQLVNTPESYYSPRHRHNFDQVRYQMEGNFDFSTDGRMEPGSIAYFPEAVHYGPQSSTGSSTTLVLQFGGASGSGYISTAQYEQAAAELARSGTFKKGVYSVPKPEGGVVNRDAYEAVWEQVNGRALRYPEPRYAKPVFMAPGNFEWIAFADAPGCARKLLGVFSGRGTQLAVLRLEPRATLGLDENSIFFVLDGTGHVGEKTCAPQTTVHLEPGETAAITADAHTELLQFGLPNFG